MFINSANAGRIYSTNSTYDSKWLFASTPQGACHAVVDDANSYGINTEYRGIIKMTNGSIVHPFICIARLIINSSIFVDQRLLIEFHDKPCPATLKENGTGSCVKPAARPKQGTSCATNSSPNPVLGDPIIIATGNSFQTEVDYQNQNPFDLSFIRYYNSTDYNVTTDIGIKWRHNYNNRLALNSATQALLYRNNGQVESPLLH